LKIWEKDIDILFSSCKCPLARHITGSIQLRLKMDGHKMQSHRCQIPHLEIKSDENFEEQTRRAAAFFGTAGSSGGISVASKVKFRDSIFH
jgi:hypothetical protein